MKRCYSWIYMQDGCIAYRRVNRVNEVRSLMVKRDNRMTDKVFCVIYTIVCRAKIALGAHFRKVPVASSALASPCATADDDLTAALDVLRLRIPCVTSSSSAARLNAKSVVALLGDIPLAAVTLQSSSEEAEPPLKPAGHLMAKRTFSGEIRPHRSSPKNIGSLFEDQEWVLEKVLHYLIDDGGLHECRRVSRKWNAVCNTLPVKLRRVPRQHLHKVLATFPNAVEVSCTPRFSSNDFDVARQLAGMSSLEHLEQLGYFTDRIHTSVEINHRETFNRLQSLGVYLKTASCENFRNALQHLTGLRKLNLEVSVRPSADPRSWRPFTELEGLRELALSARLLKNGSNQILFPSSALTKLTINTGLPINMSVPELLTVRYHSKRVPLLIRSSVFSDSCLLRRYFTILESALSSCEIR